ncbi:hypothetical protein GDO78_012715 [Eleutherodactylus coqui]|uniref:Uncharacterized protein n=1 Tax=Eleutherodactylus coqui TaxID=57060 RepID=A0A8J6EZR3_ELECQ|nr:hypothetical protein GDO78_012715 [Eleutherodactylus coqui]
MLAGLINPFLFVHVQPEPAGELVLFSYRGGAQMCFTFHKYLQITTRLLPHGSLYKGTWLPVADVYLSKAQWGHLKKDFIPVSGVKK